MKLQCPKCGNFAVMDFGSWHSKFATQDDRIPNFRFLKDLRGEEVARFECMACNHQFEAQEWLNHKDKFKKKKKN